MLYLPKHHPWYKVFAGAQPESPQPAETQSPPAMSVTLVSPNQVGTPPSEHSSRCSEEEELSVFAAYSDPGVSWDLSGISDADIEQVTVVLGQLGFTLVRYEICTLGKQPLDFRPAYLITKSSQPDPEQLQESHDEVDVFIAARRAEGGMQ